MLIGVMSDSHGDVAATARAVSLLTQRGASRLFHCGDICSVGVLEELAGRDCTFVWGNCDDLTPTLRRYVADLGLTWPEPGRVIELAGKRIGVFHGHEAAFQTATDTDTYDYIFHGHTHRYADQLENGCRLINPGALHRARLHTVALLNLKSGRLTFLRIDSGAEVKPAG